VPHPLHASDSRHSWARVTRLVVPLALVACAVLVAACSTAPGQSAASRPTTTMAGAVPTVPATPTAPVTSTTTTAPPPLYVVTTGHVAGLGTVLVDGEGLTLYMFEPDRQSGRSTCYGECENLWPPVLLVDGVKAPSAGAGVNASLLGTTVRTGDPDDLEQITYNGWPLYLWHGDSQPGEANGQGLNDSGGLWYVLDADGVPITATP
jgi:predicted lipoprotein with Yx(FWY)xxD motif